MAGDNFDALRDRLAKQRELYEQLGEWMRFDPADIASLLAERDAAFAMSRCECSADEACRNLVEWRDKLAAMTAERDALQAKVEAMEKDAGRYVWLRSDCATEFGEPWAITRYAPGDERNSDGGTCPLFGAELDDAIDAARAALAQPTGEKP